MPRRRRPIILAAAFALAGLATSGCAEQSAALRVGDVTVSQDDIEAELDAYTTSEGFLQNPAGAAGPMRSSYTQEFVGTVLSQRITFILVENLFEEQDLTLTDDDRRGVTDECDDLQSTRLCGFGGRLSNVPADLRTSLVDDLARLQKLVDELGDDGYSDALTRAVDSTDIEISSHYGSWDREQRTVVPPPGPEPARDDG